jgi:adenosylcobinamide-phosphate synthase
MSALAALAADLVLGEPPASVHPTIWMGRSIAGGRARRRSVGRTASLLEGAFLIGTRIVGAAAAGALASRAIDACPQAARGSFRGLALKPALSLRALLGAALEVETLLRRGRLPQARLALAWHLVSRDTSDLTSSEVAGAAIESVAENLSDGVVAPLLAYRAGGLAAAYAYRMLNTADAMLGYRTPELEWFGKAAARTDDAANLVPARLTAALICAAAGGGRGSSRGAARVAWNDAGRTTSPNAGWPMAAMAGALGVRLTKRDVYSLNDAGRAPRAADIARARRIGFAAATLATLAVEFL